jgi:hypothetical protein
MGNGPFVDAVLLSNLSLQGMILHFKQIGDTLLQWIQSNPVTSAEPVAKAEGSTVGSYRAFKVVALERSID